MKKLGSILFHRTVLMGVSILAQVAFLALCLMTASRSSAVVYGLSIFISFCVVIWIVNSSSTRGGYKLAWIILILVVPIFGGALYLLCRGGRFTPEMKRRLKTMEQSMDALLSADYRADEMEADAGVAAANQVRYVEKFAHCPVYRDTKVDYYPLGDDVLQPMLEALRGAKKYIFVEYFIINSGQFWGAILEVLKEKAVQGVDVRVIYDDIGCIYTLPSHYDQELAQYGIRCKAFNRFVPVVSTVMNNRDHRKILVVDGTVAFTGGVNLADEYINVKERFGHWKDSAIRLEGPAAWSMAVMFLTMWSFNAKGKEEDIAAFRPHHTPRFPDSGWVQPYTDCPWDDEPVGETVYWNLFNKAQRYIYVTTPYLVMDENLTMALISAAKAGVDVRIMTPHIPDKKSVFLVTRAHYEPLIRGGVKIYEYTPGFVHGKNVVVDDRFGTVGSVNLDYRSLYLHFENGALLVDNPAVMDIKKDFLATLEQCRPYTLKDCRQVSVFTRIFRGLLRVFAPLF